MSDLFKTGLVNIGFDAKTQTVTFTIGRDVLHVSRTEAEKYVTRLRDRKFPVIGGEIHATLPCQVDGEWYEWDFVFPLAEIPHHTGLVEQALKQPVLRIN